MTSTANNSLTQLGHLLADELAAATALEAVMTDKQHALVTHQLDLLQALCEREQAAAQRMAQIDARRCDSSLGLARQLGIPAEGLTLKQLAVSLPGEGAPGGQEAREWLLLLARSLSAKLHTLSRLNDDNRVLTNNLLDYTAMVMRLLALGPGGQSYSKSGRPTGLQPARAMLDNRV